MFLSVFHNTKSRVEEKRCLQKKAMNGTWGEKGGKGFVGLDDFRDLVEGLVCEDWLGICCIGFSVPHLALLQHNPRG